MAVNDIETEAKAAGFSKATLRRAREGLGIQPRKQDFSGQWEWGLPAAKDEQAA